MKYPRVPEGKKLIFRRYRTDKRKGKTLDAYMYGRRAWPILIDDV